MLFNYINRILKNDKLQSEKFLNQFKKYILSGLLAFTFEYLIFYLLLSYFSKFIANSTGMFVGFWISFLLNKFWSFEAKGYFLSHLLQYIVLFSINLFISNLLIYVLSDLLKITPIISKIFIMGIIVIWNFFISKYIIYKKKKIEELS